MARLAVGKWPRRGVSLACFILVGFGIVPVAGPFIEVRGHSLKQTVVPSESLELHPELIHPLRRYEVRGNKYIWGGNDCSTFVSDYMAACGKPSFTRLATAELIDPTVMKWRGFIDREITLIRPGDIIVYRYMGKYGTEQGHTGIAYNRNGSVHVIHNAMSSKGIKSQSLSSFLNLANRVALTKNGKKVIRAFGRDDYAAWETAYLARQSAVLVN